MRWCPYSYHQGFSDLLRVLLLTLSLTAISSASPLISILVCRDAVLPSMVQDRGASCSTTEPYSKTICAVDSRISSSLTASFAPGVITGQGGRFLLTRQLKQDQNRTQTLKRKEEKKKKTDKLKTVPQKNKDENDLKRGKSVIKGIGAKLTDGVSESDSDVINAYRNMGRYADFLGVRGANAKADGLELDCKRSACDDFAHRTARDLLVAHALHLHFVIREAEGSEEDV